MAIALSGCQMNRPPTASFTYDPSAPKPREEIIFYASESFDPDGEIISYALDLGDGTTASEIIVTYTYANPGDYNVTLKVTDDKGATDSETKVVSVSPWVTPSFSFNSPGPGPTGLAWDGTYLWNADTNEGKIYKLDPSSGKVIASLDASDFILEGLTWDGSYLWAVDGGECKLYKLDPNDGRIIASLNAPGSNPTGLTWDGNYLWNADADKAKIYKINPRNGKVIDILNAPGEFPEGLAWDGAYLWNVEAWEGKIYKLNPSNGQVITSFAAPGSNPTGLVWDGTYLWNADSQEGKIYRILPPEK